MSRVSEKELQASLTTAKKTPINKSSGIFDLPKELYYTLFGNHSLLDEHGNPLTDGEETAFAKQILNGTRYKYYIKVGAGGHLYNPLGLYASSEKNRHNATDKIRGRPQFRFTEVNHTVFNYYIAFLRTKNNAWLKNAEREMI